MPQEIKFRAVYTTNSSGQRVPIPALVGGGGGGANVIDLTFDDSKIYENGVQINFARLHELCKNNLVRLIEYEQDIYTPTAMSDFFIFFAGDVEVNTDKTRAFIEVTSDNGTDISNVRTQFIVYESATRKLANAPTANQKKSTTLYPSMKVMTDITDALSARLDALEFVPLEISSFTNNIGTVEIGSSLTTVKLSWTFNKTPKDVSVNGVPAGTDVSGSTDVTFQRVTEPGSKNWNIVGTDTDDTMVLGLTTAYWYNGVYYGAAASGAINDGFIRSLTRSLSNNRARTFTTNAAAGQYVWYCLPTRLGTPAFNVGGFDGGFTLAATLIYTNASGYAEEYKVWRSDNAGLGSVTVKVV